MVMVVVCRMNLRAERARNAVLFSSNVSYSMLGTNNLITAADVVGAVPTSAEMVADVDVLYVDTVDEVVMVVVKVLRVEAVDKLDVVAVDRLDVDDVSANELEVDVVEALEDVAVETLDVDDVAVDRPMVVEELETVDELVADGINVLELVEVDVSEVV